MTPRTLSEARKALDQADLLQAIRGYRKPAEKPRKRGLWARLWAYFTFREVPGCAEAELSECPANFIDFSQHVPDNRG